MGTWNLAGRWTSRHLHLVLSMECDVLLLTEVSDRLDLPGYLVHRGVAEMTPGRRWAAIAALAPIEPLPEPHGATVAVEVGSLTTCVSVLPWKGCGDRPPWRGGSTAERTIEAVGRVEAARPTIWGGDWNHALSGREWSGSVAGRRHLLGALDRLGLSAPTAAAPHQLPGVLSIDHVAVPTAWTVVLTERHPATTDDGRLSDHDAYVVETQAPAGWTDPRELLIDAERRHRRPRATPTALPILDRRPGMPTDRRQAPPHQIAPQAPRSGGDPGMPVAPPGRRWHPPSSISIP